MSSELTRARVLDAFGLAGVMARREPSLVSTVYRIQSDRGEAFLKRHGRHDRTQVDLAIRLSERLRVGGIRAPRTLPTVDGRLYIEHQNHLFTLTEALEGEPLAPSDVDEPKRARCLGEFLARVHAALNHGPSLNVPCRPSVWRDQDHLARIARAERRLLSCSPSVERRSMLYALEFIRERPEMRQRLDAVSSISGIVHGDFWPGNLLAVSKDPVDLTDLAVIDLEFACSAPRLLDVAHCVDLGFRHGGGRGSAIDLALASAFAGAYARASGLDGASVRRLPQLLLAARGCSILWTVERHLDAGPNPLDRLVAGDVRRARHVLDVLDEWEDRIGADIALASRCSA